MTELEFIIKQISKTNKKNYENYVVTRIWHKINNEEIKFVTQQYVSRPNGHALTDMYFPQFNLHIEIDEPFHESQKELDIKRETDVIEATGHVIERIKITDDLRFVNNQIDRIVVKIEKLQLLQIKNKSFEPWNLKKELDPLQYKIKGYLDIRENPAFRTILDASNCLGQNYKGVQQAWFPSKVYSNHYLWFPKFYANARWDNKMIENGNTIIEKCKIEGKKETYVHDTIKKYKSIKRIVFPRSKDNLGSILYKFKGVYIIDEERSNESMGMVYKRIKTRFDI
jgi:very-short-patch-repair endonuclease